MAAVQDFVSYHSPVNNFPRDDMTGKEGHGYGGGRQYRGPYGTGHSSCAPNYYLLGGIPTAELPHYCKETFTAWGDIVGKIFTSGFFRYVFTSFLLLV